MADDADDEEQLTKPDLYVCLDECYIYQQPGDENGNPKDDSDILYDTKTDEVIQLQIENEECLRKGNYVRVTMPVEGWVYLPPDKENHEYSWSLLDRIYKRKKRKNELEKEALLTPEELKKKREKEKERKNKDGNEDDNDDDKDDDEQDNNNYEPDLKGIKEDKEENKYDDDDETIIIEERRNYTQQRMMMCTKFPDLDEIQVNKFMENKYLRELLFYFRRHPFLPGLIILVIQAVVECIILFDVYSDMRLAIELFDSDNEIIFAGSMAFIAAPYIIAWTVVSQYSARRLKEHQGDPIWIFGICLFNIAPIGIILLFLGDIYHWFECVFIKPIFYVFTGGKQIRTISYEELGYYKLRRVSEIFAEAMPQAVIQLLLLVAGNVCSKCELLSVITALISSLFVLALWVTILILEGKQNGMGFVEYTTVVFQGSFKFVPLLPAIERGTKTGEKVNWTWYKLSAEGVGHVAKAVNSPNCRLNTLKITKYTIKDLHRFACRYLGASLNNSQTHIKLILGRMEEEISQLFVDYDEDGSQSLDLQEFVHLSLIIKQKMEEPCLRSDVFVVYSELADSYAFEVWMLDLIVKIRGSKQYIDLLDYSLPLQNAYQSGDLRLISLLMASEYDKQNEDNQNEFEKCVSNAITTGKVREALCLCEHKGVPIVVQMVSGENLLPMDDDGKSDPYVRVCIFDDQNTTEYRKQTLDPIWNEDLLFIMPFQMVDRLVHSDEFQKSQAELQASLGGDYDHFGGGGGINESFAAINISTGVVVGPSLPSYCQKAIASEAAKHYGKSIQFQVAKNAMEYESALADISDKDKLPQYNKNADSGGSNTLGVSSAGQSRFEASSEYATKDTKEGMLAITFRVFDHDVDDEDDYMGAFKAKIPMKTNTMEYHTQLQTAKLQYLAGHENQHKAGNISYRIFLNAVQIYQESGLKYIDDLEQEDKPIETILDIFKPKIVDGPVQYGIQG